MPDDALNIACETLELVREHFSAGKVDLAQEGLALAIEALAMLHVRCDQHLWDGEKAKRDGKLQ